jgi:altronate dehydratase small subunit
MSENQYRSVMMKLQDNVAVALTDIPKGTVLDVFCKEQKLTVTLQKNIEFGHKFAVKAIQNGDNIIKYGEVIGAAIIDIQPGEHVHVHNLEGKRGRGDKIAETI